MEYQEAIHRLTSGIQLQANVYKRLFAAGLTQEKAQSEAEEIIHELFTSDIPRPELVEAYNRIGG